MTKRVFIIHGWDGVPNDSWKPWLKRELESRGFEIIAPQMPGGNNPKVEEWTELISSLVKKPTKEDYFIGHSLGCISILRYLETLNENQKVGGCVFVSGFMSPLNVPEIDGFCEKSLDIRKIKSVCKNVVLIHSDNDIDVPMEKAEELKTNLNAKLILEHGMGHISEGDGIRELPNALTSILSFKN